MAALERAAEGLVCKTAVHICYGYGIQANIDWKSTLGSEWRQYEAIFPALAASRIDQVSLECRNARVPLRLMQLLAGKDVMVGVIDVATDRVETPEEVADTIEHALEFVPAKRLFPARTAAWRRCAGTWRRRSSRAGCRCGAGAAEARSVASGGNRRGEPMILTANSETARQTARRKSGNGWHTTFIGQNRNTLKLGEAPPEAGTLYPMAFLVEKEPHAVVRPHFHQADQYQVVVQGGGRLGQHDVGSVAVHYTDAWSAYGPIVAADEGIAGSPCATHGFGRALHAGCPRAPPRGTQRGACITVRQRQPPMPAASASRVVAHRAGRLPGGDRADGGRHGDMALSPAGEGKCHRPDLREGGGQFWIVLSGSAQAGGIDIAAAELLRLRGARRRLPPR